MGKIQQIQNTGSPIFFVSKHWFPAPLVTRAAWNQIFSDVLRVPRSVTVLNLLDLAQMNSQASWIVTDQKPSRRPRQDVDLQTSLTARGRETSGAENQEPDNKKAGRPRVFDRDDPTRSFTSLSW